LPAAPRNRASVAFFRPKCEAVRIRVENDLPTGEDARVFSCSGLFDAGEPEKFRKTDGSDDICSRLQ